MLHSMEGKTASNSGAQQTWGRGLQMRAKRKAGAWSSGALEAMVRLWVVFKLQWEAIESF